jgi:hypothetical protein
MSEDRKQKTEVGKQNSYADQITIYFRFLSSDLCSLTSDIRHLSTDDSQTS